MATIDRNDPSNKRSNEFKNKLNPQNLDNRTSHYSDFNFDFEGFDDDKDRSPDSGKKDKFKINWNALGRQSGSAAAHGIAAALANALPKSAEFVQKASDLGTDIGSMKDEVMSNIDPMLAQAKIISNRILPRVEKVLPKNLYDKLSKSLASDVGTGSGYQVPSKDAQRLSHTQDTLNAIFKSEMAMRMDEKRQEAVNRIVDTKVDNIRHGQLLQELDGIRRQSFFQTNFLRSTYMAYLQKDLQLKYQMLYTQQDILTANKLGYQTIGIALEKIRHNTGLPDFVKKRGLEAAKEAIYQKVLGSASEKLTGYGGKILQNIKSKYIDMPLSLLSMGLGMADMSTSMMAMENLSPAERLTNLLASLTGKYVGGKLGKGLSDTLTKEQREQIESFAGNAPTMIPLLLDQIKRTGKIPAELLPLLGGADGNGNILGYLAKFAASNAEPLDFKAKVRDRNKLDPDAEGTITNHFTQAVESIIPGYLRMQTRYLEAIAYGVHPDKVEERTWNPSKGQFDTISGVKRSLRDQLYSSTSATNTLAKSASALMTADMDAADKSKLTANLSRQITDENGNIDYQKTFDTSLLSVAKVMRNIANNPSYTNVTFGSDQMLWLQDYIDGNGRLSEFSDSKEATKWADDLFGSLDNTERLDAAKLLANILGNEQVSSGVRRRMQDDIVSQINNLNRNQQATDKFVRSSGLLEIGAADDLFETTGTGRYTGPNKEYVNLSSKLRGEAQGNIDFDTWKKGVRQGDFSKDYKYDEQGNLVKLTDEEIKERDRKKELAKRVENSSIFKRVTAPFKTIDKGIDKVIEGLLRTSKLADLNRYLASNGVKLAGMESSTKEELVKRVWQWFKSKSYFEYSSENLLRKLIFEDDGNKPIVREDIPAEEIVNILARFPFVFKTLKLIHEAKINDKEICYLVNMILPDRLKIAAELTQNDIDTICRAQDPIKAFENYLNSTKPKETARATEASFVDSDVAAGKDDSVLVTPNSINALKDKIAAANAQSETETTRTDAASHPKVSGATQAESGSIKDEHADASRRATPPPFGGTGTSLNLGSTNKLLQMQVDIQNKILDILESKGVPTYSAEEAAQIDEEATPSDINSKGRFGAKLKNLSRTIRDRIKNSNFAKGIGGLGKFGFGAIKGSAGLLSKLGTFGTRVGGAGLDALGSLASMGAAGLRGLAPLAGSLAEGAGKLGAVGMRAASAAVTSLFGPAGLLLTGGAKLLGKGVGVLFGTDQNPYIDVFVKDVEGNFDPKTPRIKGIKIKEGVDDEEKAEYFTTDGKILKSAYDIKGAIYSRDGKTCFISEDEVARICDASGKKLIKGGLLGRIVGAGAGLVGGLIKGVLGGAKGLLGFTGRLLSGGFDLTKGIFKLPARALGGVTKLFGTIFGGAFKFAGIAGREDLQSIVGDKLEDLYIMLHDGTYSAPSAKGVAGDTDGDGTREGSYEEFKKKRDARDAARKAQREADAKEKAKGTKSDKAGGGGFLSKLLGLFGKKDEDDEEGGGFFSNLLGTALGSKLGGLGTKLGGGIRALGGLLGRGGAALGAAAKTGLGALASGFTSTGVGSAIASGLGTAGAAIMGGLGTAGTAIAGGLGTAGTAVGSAALSGLGAIGTGLGTAATFLVSNPIGWAISAGLALYGGYKLISWMMEDSDTVTRWKDCRYSLYGADPNNEDMREALDDLEDDVLDILFEGDDELDAEDLEKHARALGFIKKEGFVSKAMRLASYANPLGWAARAGKALGGLFSDKKKESKKWDNPKTESEWRMNFFNTWYATRMRTVFKLYCDIVKKYTPQEDPNEKPDPDDIDSTFEPQAFSEFERMGKELISKDDISKFAPTEEAYQEWRQQMEEKQMAGQDLSGELGAGSAALAGMGVSLDTEKDLNGNALPQKSLTDKLIGASKWLGPVGWIVNGLFGNDDTNVDLHWKSLRYTSYGAEYEKHNRILEDMEDDCRDYFLDGDDLPDDDDIAEYAEQFGLIAHTGLSSVFSGGLAINLARRSRETDEGRNGRLRYFKQWFHDRFLPMFSLYLKVAQQACKCEPDEEPDVNDIPAMYQKESLEAYKKAIDEALGQKPEIKDLLPTEEGYLKWQKKKDEEKAARRGAPTGAAAGVLAASGARDYGIQRAHTVDTIKSTLKWLGPVGWLANGILNMFNDTEREARWKEVKDLLYGVDMTQYASTLEEIEEDVFDMITDGDTIDDKTILRWMFEFGISEAFDGGTVGSLFEGNDAKKARDNALAYGRAWLLKRFKPIFMIYCRTIQQACKEEYDWFPDVEAIPEMIHEEVIEAVEDQGFKYLNSHPEVQKLIPTQKDFEAWVKEKETKSEEMKKQGLNPDGTKITEEQKAKEAEDERWNNLTLGEKASEIMAKTAAKLNPINIASSVVSWLFGEGADEEWRKIRFNGYGLTDEDIDEYGDIVDDLEQEVHAVICKRRGPIFDKELTNWAEKFDLIDSGFLGFIGGDSDETAGKKLQYFRKWFELRFLPIFQAFSDIVHQASHDPITSFPTPDNIEETNRAAALEQFKKAIASICTDDVKKLKPLIDGFEALEKGVELEQNKVKDEPSTNPIQQQAQQLNETTTEEEVDEEQPKSAFDIAKDTVVNEAKDEIPLDEALRTVKAEVNKAKEKGLFGGLKSLFAWITGESQTDNRLQDAFYKYIGIDPKTFRHFGSLRDLMDDYLEVLKAERDPLSDQEIEDYCARFDLINRGFLHIFGISGTGMNNKILQDRNEFFRAWVLCRFAPVYATYVHVINVYSPKGDNEELTATEPTDVPEDKLENALKAFETLAAQDLKEAQYADQLEPTEEGYRKWYDIIHKGETDEEVAKQDDKPSTPEEFGKMFANTPEGKKALPGGGPIADLLRRMGILKEEKTATPKEEAQKEDESFLTKVKNFFSNPIDTVKDTFTSGVNALTSLFSSDDENEQEGGSTTPSSSGSGGGSGGGGAIAPVKVPDGDMQTNARAIWKFLLDRGLTPEGAAGLMGNLRAESTLRANIVQRGMGHTDDGFTQLLDELVKSGKGKAELTKIMKKKPYASVGYGLAQWTTADRKAGLVLKARKNGTSVADLNTQLEFLMDELGGKYYSKVWKTLTSAKSVEEASTSVLKGFERPADMGPATVAKRASFGQGFFDLLAKGEKSEEEQAKDAEASQQADAQTTDTQGQQGTQDSGNLSGTGQPGYVTNDAPGSTSSGVGETSSSSGAGGGGSDTAGSTDTQSAAGDTGGSTVVDPKLASALKEYVVPKDKSVNLEGLDPKFKARLAAAAKDFKDQTGKKLQINEAKRDPKHQAELWVRGRILHEPGIHTPAKPPENMTITYKGKQYKVPGSGRKNQHILGAAVDVPARSGVAQTFEPFARKYGLGRPWAQKDPPHFQVTDASKGVGEFDGTVNDAPPVDNSNPQATEGTVAQEGQQPAAVQAMQDQLNAKADEARQDNAPTAEQQQAIDKQQQAQEAAQAAVDKSLSSDSTSPSDSSTATSSAVSSSATDTALTQSTAPLDLTNPDVNKSTMTNTPSQTGNVGSPTEDAHLGELKIQTQLLTELRDAIKGYIEGKAKSPETEAKQPPVETAPIKTGPTPEERTKSSEIDQNAMVNAFADMFKPGSPILTAIANVIESNKPSSGGPSSSYDTTPAINTRRQAPAYS